MNILRYYEAKEQNRNTADLLRELGDDGRATLIPGAIGLHYMSCAIDPDQYKPDPDGKWKKLKDHYIIRLLECSNSIQGYSADNGDFRVTGAHHCGQTKFCAVCATREARKVSSQLAYNFNRLKDNDYQYFMLTLTLPNNYTGFRQEFLIYNRCLRDIFAFVGLNDYNNVDSVRNYCEGAFGARELTYSKDKGWHPHIHIILAYDKKYIGDCKVDRKGSIKSLVLNTRRGKILSAFSIRDKFQSLILKKFPDYYYDHLEAMEKGLNIDFRPITDIENSVDELCKYFIDYRSFKDADTLLVYLRDIYNMSKYSKYGCFSWNAKRELAWREWCRQGKPSEENAHFIQFAGWDNPNYVYFGRRKVRYNNQIVDVPCFYKNTDICPEELTYSWNSCYKRYERVVYNNNQRLVTDVLDYVQLTKLIKLPRDDLSELYALFIEEREKDESLTRLYKSNYIEERGQT